MTASKESFVWTVAGAAGEGIMTTGLLFSKTCSRHGLYIFDYSEYPSLIRGGHNTYQVHFGMKPVFCQKSKIDVLVALDKKSLELHKDELTADSIILYDKETQKAQIEEYGLPG